MPSPAYRLAAWPTVVRPHADVREGALEMGTYAVNLARVFRGTGSVPAVYANADRFFAATYLTSGLRRLLSDVTSALAGGAGDHVLQLRTPFGGGKTHTLVALLHLARHRSESVAAMPELADLADPGPVKVAVLSGEELDPLSANRASGPETRTLWGELAAQLGRYELLADHDAAGSAPGGARLAEVIGEGPVLILLDEVLVYVEKAMAVERGESTLGRQAMLFVQALTEVVNTLPQAVMVYSLQASVGEAVGAEGLLTQLDHLVSRVDAKREPVSGEEVLRVVQRRLFDDLGDPAVRREVATRYADLVRRQLVAEAETDDARREADAEAARLERRILDAYPLHPSLLDCMYHRWGTLPSYQRTRGALQFLASATHALLRDGDDGALIGPGEVDLADEATRGAFFSQVGERERYTAVLDADILSGGSGARAVDRRIGADAPGLERLQVGTRMATAVMLHSFGTPEGAEGRGVLETDLVAAALVPELDRNVVVAALHELREEELYLHYTARRYRYEPKANLTKLVRDEANKFRPEEVLAYVREELERQLAGARPSPAVWPVSPAGVRDHVPGFTVAYLQPDWSADADPVVSFVETAQGGRRDYKNAIGFALPDTGQFDRARAAARVALAADSLLGKRATFGLGPEQVEELKEKAAAAARDLTATVSRAYEQVAVPVRTDGGASPFRMETVDLRAMLTAGRTLHQRVMEALSHRVFDRITVDKLVSLTGLGPDRPAVRCAEVVDWFFSYFEFTKIARITALSDAVARGVLDARIGYATGVTPADDGVRVTSPERVRFRQMVPDAEIDLSGEAWLLTAELAERLAGPDDEAAGAGPGKGDEEVVAGRTSSGSTASAQTPGTAARSHADVVQRVALRARLDADGLFALNKALAWLREQSSALDVEVTVRATAKPPGIDPVRFRNGVVEPLEEGGAELSQEELS